MSDVTLPLQAPVDTSAAPIDAVEAHNALTALPATTVTVSMTPAECANQLRRRFPALFGGAVKPLKLRIQLDIQLRAPGVFAKQALSAFFRRYTGSTAYLLAMSKAPARLDLDGHSAGDISEEHRQAALAELARRRANQDERRQLEEVQRRRRAGLLHDFQTTTLTKPNFCALKGVSVDELDGLLEMARTEAEARPRQTPSHTTRARHPEPLGNARKPREQGEGAPSASWRPHRR